MKRTRQILAFLLCAALLFGLLPSYAHAATILEVYPDLNFDDTCTRSDYYLGDVELPDCEINFGPSECCVPNLIDACFVYIPSIVPATCARGGYTGDAFCSMCLKVFYGTETAPLDHSFTDGVCSVCGQNESDIVTPDIPEDVITGMTDNGITWTFAPKTGALMLSGNCEIDSFSYEVDAPWQEYADQILSIELDSGITGIGSFAFAVLANLENVTIPETVEYIARSAFDSCTSLKDLTIPSSVTSIGEAAFSNCDALTQVVLPDSVEFVAPYAFAGCSALRSIRLPAGLTVIPEKMLMDCYSLETVAIPASVTSIGREAFAYDPNLKQLELPDGLKIIGYYAFTQTGLTKIVIPESMDSIGVDAFASCAALENVAVCNPECVIYDSALTLGLAEITTIHGYTGSSAQSYAETYGYAFKAFPCEEHSFTNGVCTVCGADEGWTFDEATGTLTIKTQAAMDAKTWSGISAEIKKVVIEDGVTKIADSAFFGYKNVTEVIISDSVESIGKEAFSFCEKLAKVTLSAGLTAFEDYVFNCCFALTSITIPDSVTSIGNYAFCDCRGLTEITLPNSVTTIGIGAFNNCEKITEITIPEGLTEISERVFYNCEALKAVTIPDSVESIGEYAFQSCGSLTTVKLPEGLKSIGEGAFFWCGELEEITFPESLTSIGAEAFYYCFPLQSVVIPKNVTYVGDGAFEGCMQLRHTTVLNPDCEIVGGWNTLGEHDPTTIHGYHESTAQTFAEKYELPFELIVPDCDHADMVYLERVESTCSEKGHREYWYCNDCKICFVDKRADYAATYNSLLLHLKPHSYGTGETCTACGYGLQFFVEMSDREGNGWGDDWNPNAILVYENDVLIEKLTFKSGTYRWQSFDYNKESNYRFVWNSGNFANECSFTITLGDDVIYECADGSVLTDDADFLTVGSGWSFDEETGTLTVRTQAAMDACGRDSEFHNLRPWEHLKEQIKAVKVLDGITGIGEYAFFQCHSLETVELPDSLTSIGAGAFGECFVMEEIMIPDSVTEIGTWAFGECDCLKSIILPKNLTVLNSSVFLLCGSLENIELPDGLTSIGKNAFTHCAPTSIVIPASVTSIGQDAFYFCDELTSITICNPQCEIYDAVETLGNYEVATIYGYENSTAQAYAEKYGYAFEIIGPILDEEMSVNMDISAGAEMVVKYSFMAADVSSYEDFYLVVEKEMADGKTITTTYGVLEEKGTKSSDRKPLSVTYHPVTGEPLIYSATFEGINAKEMGDIFTTTLYGVDANGIVHYNPIEASSMKDFLLGKLNDPTASDAQKTMVVDMLCYGAAAQVYLDYNADALVTDCLTSEQLAYATRGTPEAIDFYAMSGEGATVTTDITAGSKVALKLSTIAMNVSDPSNLKCVITDEAGKVLAELTTDSAANILFTATYDNVGARQMRNVITATFYDGQTPISRTVHWSVESYVAQARAKATATAEEIAMVNAMLIYGDSIAAYLSESGL